MTTHVKILIFLSPLAILAIYDCWSMVFKHDWYDSDLNRLARHLKRKWAK